MASNKPTDLAPAAQLPEFDNEAINANQNTLSNLNTAYSEQRDVLNQMIGQIQMTGAIAKLTTVVGLTKLAHIKETKMYKALQGKSGFDRNGNEIADVGTWEGFCLAIGTTRQTADEEILNLKAFGETALEDLSRIGAGIRELRQLRKLPEDEKLALIETAKNGDKDAFLDLAEEIIARNAKVKNENEELKATAEAREKVIDDKNQRIDDIATQLAKAKRRIEIIEPNVAHDEIRQEASQHAYAVEAGIRGQLREALQAVQFNGDIHQMDVSHWLQGQLTTIEKALADLRHELGIERSLDDGAWTPDMAKK